MPAPEPTHIVPKHHGLVRLAHWANVPLLLLLVATGMAIYWAAPVFTHPRDPVTHSNDYIADLGIALARLTGDRGPAPGDWVYDRVGLGTRLLAEALALHWLLAFLFMLNGLLYALGLAAGGGWRALLPRVSDPAGAWAMIRYYLGIVPMAILRRPWPHPPVRGKYNPLQRAGYFAMPVAGILVVLSGWAMHKPVQLGWLERLFGDYEGARIVHFAAMFLLASFVVPHVVLVVADGWDTFRSMVVGWSARVTHATEPVVEADARRLRAASRRDFLLLAAGAVGTLAGAWWLLPERTKQRLLPGGTRRHLDTLAARVGLTPGARRRALDGVLTFDDDVAEALYSKDRRVRTYARSAVTPLRVNYHGRTPDASILPGWALEVRGLAAPGSSVRLTLDDLVSRLPLHEEGTRLVCVEGWSAVAWWGGFRFADFLAAFPPRSGARWAALRSAVNLDAHGRPDPYYVSLDLATARHPQVLLATRKDGRPLTLGHGAPLRLVAPMKLGLKNIKGLTAIEYVEHEPADYWNERGYSRYDGL
ncbi:MAG: molybdopterin-dependent oxidoreductase [Candidatus Eisenbacteria bacterium]